MDRRAYREEMFRNSARKTEGKGALSFATFTYRYCADIEFASFSFCLAAPAYSLSRRLLFEKLPVARVCDDGKRKSPFARRRFCSRARSSLTQCRKSLQRLSVWLPCQKRHATNFARNIITAFNYIKNSRVWHFLILRRACLRCICSAPTNPSSLSLSLSLSLFGGALEHGMTSGFKAMKSVRMPKLS